MTIRTVHTAIVVMTALLLGCAERPTPDIFFSLRGADVRVIRYLIDGKTYYYVVSPCCDRPNPLFDAQGRHVCAPDGGYYGHGDGKCGALRVDGTGVSEPNPFKDLSP